MSFIDWTPGEQAAQMPAEVPALAQKSALAGFQIGQQRAMLHALRGVDLSQPDSVDNAMRGLTSIGMADQAKAISDLAVTRAANTAVASHVGPLIGGAFDAAQGAMGGQSQSQTSPPPQAPAPDIQGGTQKVLQQGADATGDLLATSDPVARANKAAAYRTQFTSQGVPEANINEVLSDLSDKGLAAHHAFLDSAAKGGDVTSHPTGFAATNSLMNNSDNPGYAQAASVLNSGILNPYLQAVMSKYAGLDLGPGISNALAVTGPARSAAASAPYSPVSLPGPQGQPVVVSAANFATGQGSPTAQPIVGATPGQITAQTEAAGAPYRPVTVTGPQGQPITESALQFAAGRGAPPPPPGLTGPANTPPVTGPTIAEAQRLAGAGAASVIKPPEGGYVPFSGQNVVQGGVQSIPGYVPTEIARVAQVGAAQTGGVQAAQQLQADREAVGNSQSQMVALRKTYDLLPDTNTGPGTESTNTWRSFLHSQVPALDKLFPGFDERTIDTANYDELKKYMVQLAGAAASQYGQGTNQKLEVAASGNPNPTISNMASRDVTRMNIALLRAQQAKIAAFDQSGLPSTAYPQFSADYARTVDPRAFMLDLLNPAQRQKMLSQIQTDSEKRGLLKGKKTAEETGFFSESDIPR